MDTATDVSVVSHDGVQSHPTLPAVPLKLVPPAAVSLRAANGSPINDVGFIDTTLTVTALVGPSLGPDSVLLDNSVMSEFGVILDRENQTLYFSSTTVVQSHRLSAVLGSLFLHVHNRSSSPRDSNLSAAAVHSVLVKLLVPYVNAST